MANRGWYLICHCRDISSNGTDCRRCVKRRIKCDRSIPQCQKCNVRGYDCPGFESIQLKWNQGVASRGRLKGENFPIISRKEVSSIQNSQSPENAWAQTHISLVLESDLHKPQSRDILTDRLHNHFNFVISPLLMWADEPSNPWRNKVFAFAQQSSHLNRSLLSLSAAHMTATSAEETESSPFLREVDLNLYDASLRALRNMLARETSGSNSEERQPRQNSRLTEIFAIMLVLCHRELIIPGSTNWDLHLKACRPIIENLRRAPGDEFTSDTIKFLSKEVMDLEMFGKRSSFIEDIGHRANVQFQHVQGDRFWSFTSFVDEATKFERVLYMNEHLKKANPAIDLSFWEGRLCDAYAATCNAMSTAQPNKMTKFDAVIRSHYYACLIYCYQCFGSENEAARKKDSFVDLLHSEIELIAATVMEDFAHDIVWPLFVAGTESWWDVQRQKTVEDLFMESICKSGFWCNHGALEFLRGFWKSTNTGGWLKYARDRRDEIGTFLIF